MRKQILLTLASVAAIAASAAVPTLRTGREWLEIRHDGRRHSYAWVVNPQIAVDSLESSARTVTFISDIDTINITGLDIYQSADFVVVTASGDTAVTRVVRIPEVLYENPPVRLRRQDGSVRLSREQASFDLDALKYALSQIHPDIYSVVGQEKLLTAFNDAKRSLPDSLTTIDLYRIAAPLVSMIGDGHTCLGVPYNDLFTKELKRLPLSVTPEIDMSLTARSSLDSIIPAGSKILSINDITASDMLDAMLPFVSGERRHFKISRINYYFSALFEMLYGGKEHYSVRYVAPGSKKEQTALLPAVDWEQLKARVRSSAGQAARREPYSYSIRGNGKIAVMEFNQCVNPAGMKNLCDSMFADLRSRGIRKLIIDVRDNGGGNSQVGDVLLRYIARKPFIQFSKSLVRISPMTARMTGRYDGCPRIDFSTTQDEYYIRPYDADNGHFDGEVVLLTSHNTFSSASSFAWAFKEAGAGKTIGEETGGMNVCYGDILTWRAPVSGIPCTISYKRFWQMNADENDIHGALPDVAVPADKALDKALRMLK